MIRDNRAIQALNKGRGPAPRLPNLPRVGTRSEIFQFNEFIQTGGLNELGNTVGGTALIKRASFFASAFDTILERAVT